MNIYFILPIIIIIVIVIIIVVVLNRKNNNYFQLFTNLNEYRLGDIYNGNDGENMPKIEKYHIKNFNDSIASDYIRQSKTYNDINTLLQIIKNRSNSSNSKSSSNSSKSNSSSSICIVHLRVGDILEGVSSNKLKKKYYNNEPKDSDKIPVNNNINYINSENYYKNKIKKLKNLGINNVIIIAGSHKKYNNYTNSTFYINEIKELFEKNGIKVELRLAKNPDDDILLVYKSKYFIPSKGGYSRLMEEIINKSGGIII